MTQFPILSLSGSARERGVQHGRGAASRVAHSVASYARLFAYYRGHSSAEMRQRATAYLPVLETHAPELLDEMRGIADGAGRAFEEILALNARTELLAGALVASQHPGFDAAVAANRAAGVPQHADAAGGASGGVISECTTVAALPEASVGGRTWLAQNWDWSGDQRAACVVLRITQSGRPNVLTMTEAGIVGKIGINDAGVAVALNILSSTRDGREPGMPVHVLLRLMMDAESLEDARALTRRAQAGGSSCITIADARGGAVCLEITPGGVGELHPIDGLLAHSNHCLCADAQSIACAIPVKSSTVPRYSRASQLLQGLHGCIDAPALQSLLRDREGDGLAICRYPDMSLHPIERVESVCGVVMDTHARVMHLSPDVPERAPFEAIAVSA